MAERAPSKHRLRLPVVVAAVAAIPIAVAAWLAGPGSHGGTPEASPLPPATMAADLPGPAGENVLALAGGLPTRVVAPAAGIDAAITEVGVVTGAGGPEWEIAWQAAGHHMNSARPGQPGNMVITGHVSVADSRNAAVFRTLDRLAPGDVIEVYSGDQVYRYSVERVMVVPPSAVGILRSDHVARVTLLTCTRDLKNRLVVVGTLM